MGKEKKEGRMGRSQEARRELKGWVGGREGHRGETGCIRGTSRSLVWMEHRARGGKRGEARE